MKTQENQKITYGNYCRKSSESEDRQMLSIDSQIDEGKKLADSLGVRIDPEFLLTESKSAKNSGTRPKFEEMIKLIEKGRINGIIAWHPDRLSRNAIDAARLIEQMDKGNLVEIVTPGQTFRNTPFDKFMFMLQCSQAKMENDKKGVDVKRGLGKTAELGNLPGLAPIGYLNDIYAPKGQKRIKEDPERFSLVRKMWELMLTGAYSPRQISNMAMNDWGLRTKKGNRLSDSAIYWIFRNPFFYGMFEYPQGSGMWYRGEHTPMITEEEFDRVQVLLGKKGKPRPKSHVFDFTGMMYCGECGAMITAEMKVKKQKNGNIHTYIFYHCTKRKNPHCSQGSIEVKELKRQVLNEITSINIPPEFHDFAMKWFAKENEKEVGSQTAVLGGQQKAYNAIVKKLSNLVDMRVSGEIEEEEFKEKQAEYLAEKKDLKKLLDRTDIRIDQWNETADEMLTFIEKAKIKFANGNRETKRRILSTLGSNLLLKDKILNIDIEETLIPMEKVSEEVNAIKERLEPLDTIEKQKVFEEMCSQNTIVLPR